MVINQIPFKEGPVETMAERLFQTMNAMDPQWQAKVKPATQNQIHALQQTAGIQQYGRSIPFAYLQFLETMGQNDNGLLAQEWDGGIEANIDSIIEDYAYYIDLYEIDRSEYLLFCTNWTESALFLKLATGENPPVYHCGKLFAGSFEKYLFQMAFRKMERTRFSYEIDFSSSPKAFADFLSQMSTPEALCTKPIERIEQMLKPYRLQKAWFSDEVHFLGVSSEYIMRVDLDWALNIIVSSDQFSVLQKMKKSLNELFREIANWSDQCM